MNTDEWPFNIGCMTSISLKSSPIDIYFDMIYTNRISTSLQTVIVPLGVVGIPETQIEYNSLTDRDSGVVR